MRKISFFTFFMLFSIHANAYDVEINGIYYNLIKKAKSAEVTNDKKYSWSNSEHPYEGDVTIPENFEYEGVTYTVTSITSYAFKGFTDLKSVKMPESVLSIGDDAFRGCKQLESVNIPSKISFIGTYAFAGCAIKEATLPFGITEVPDGLFSNCSALESVTIPFGVLSIGVDAFYRCEKLSSVEFPTSILYILRQAFYGCNFTDLYLPDRLLYIGSSAFAYCSKLSHIEIGSKLLGLYDEAFGHCSEITDVYCYAEVPPSIKEDGDGIFYESFINYATLHVLESVVNQYKYKKPWSEFGKIVAINEEEVGFSDIAANEIVIRKNGNNLIIHGVKNGERIAVYSLFGRQAGSAVVSNNMATIPINLNNCDLVIVKIGDRVMKVELSKP